MEGVKEMGVELGQEFRNLYGAGLFEHVGFPFSLLL